jgi:hypothetical protein
VLHRKIGGILGIFPTPDQLRVKVNIPWVAKDFRGGVRSTNQRLRLSGGVVLALIFGVLEGLNLLRLLLFCHVPSLTS